MKFHAPLTALALVASLSAAETPKVFEGLFDQDVPIKGQFGMVLPPKEINKYVAKVESSARKDIKGFREFSSKAKPGQFLPYDERLGLTQEEYNDYRELWNKREFRPMAEVSLLLRQSAGNTWSVLATGEASPISTLRYQPKEDVFRSPNGDLKRMEDPKQDASSIYGEWSGHEWKFEEETGLGKTTEVISIGRFADNKSGIIIYRVQELSTEGTRLLDKSFVIRFPLGKSNPSKETKSVTSPTKSESTKSTKPTRKK